MIRAARSLLALPLLSLLACGGYEGTATQKIELKDGDIENGTISAEKELDSSNSTWEDFLKEAKGALGAEPTALTVKTVSITFDATKAKNVGQFEDAVKGDLIVSFRIKDTSEIIDVAKITDPKGTGTVELDVTTADVTGQRAKLKAGSFKIGVRASTDKAKGNDLTLPFIVTFGLEAE